MIQPGTILGGQYEIIKRIGSGGMADVYQAKCHKLNRYVAIKVLRQEFNEDAEFVQRFVAEAQATAGLVHPNIVTVYDTGEDQGYRYIVMELCEGTTLKRYIRRYGRLSVRETVDIAKQIAKGLLAAHNQKIIHRDIKPQNILVSESGTIKIADFGIAKAATGNTNTPNLLGSVHYLSPEQARGRFADQRSDIYSLGITMFEMATGKVPFDGENSVTIALMHLQDEITPPRCYFPDIPASLEKIILKCTMKRTADRYQNAQQLIDDLDRVFESPDGEYVFIQPDVDESPTIHRSKEDLDVIDQSLKQREEKSDSTSPAFIQPEMPELPEEEEDEEDDEEVEPKMRRMIYAIAAAAGIMLVMILVYLLVSSMGIWRLHNNKAENTSTEAVTETTTTEDLTIAMPNVLKYKRNDAEKLLRDNHLRAKFVYDESVGEELDEDLIVIAQQYNPGDKLDPETIVKLTLGPDPEATTETKRVEVPLLINETQESAEKILAEAGLTAKCIYATSDVVKEGYVMKQNPQAGTEVDRDFTITITISLGLSQVKVPPLTGLTPDAARKQLNDIGLELGEVTSDYSGSVGVGEVFRQGIPSGTMVDKGTTVSVVISLGDHTSHYEGQISIEDSPFEENEIGSVRLVLEQDGKNDVIYNKTSASADDFPLNLRFDGRSEGNALVVIYVNDREYQQTTVHIDRIDD